MDSVPYPINLTKSTSVQPARKCLDKDGRAMHMADKEFIQAILRGTLLHKVWELWLSPLPLHCIEQGGGMGWEEQERAQAGTFCKGKRIGEGKGE